MATDTLGSSTHTATTGRRLVSILVSAIISLAIPISLAIQLRVQVENGFSDFQGFYGAGKIVGSGLGAQLYDPATQSRMQQVSTIPGIRTGHFFIHAPFEALLFVPFAKLPFPLGAWCWWSFSLFWAYATLYLLRPHLPWISSRLDLALLTISFFIPLIATLFQGQDSILTLFLFAVCFASLKRGRYWLAGSVLAVAMYKPPLAVPMIALLLITSSKRFSILAGFIGTCMLLFCAAVAAVGWTCVVNYPLTLSRFPKVQSGSFHVSDMPNVRGLVTLALQFHASQRTILLTVIAISVLMLALTVKSAQKAHTEDEDYSLVFALFVTVSVLVGFQEYAYDLSLLYLSILLVWDWSRTRPGSTPHQKRLMYLTMVLLFASILTLLNPPVYACTIVVFFGSLSVKLLSTTRNPSFKSPA